MPGPAPSPSGGLHVGGAVPWEFQYDAFAPPDPCGAPNGGCRGSGGGAQSSGQNDSLRPFVGYPAGSAGGGVGGGGGAGVSLGCPCPRGVCPDPPPTGPYVHYVYIAIQGGGGNRMRWPLVTCVETGVSYAADCTNVAYDYDALGTKTYVTQGGRAGHCLWLNIKGTAGSGQATGANPNDVVAITAPFTPD